MVNEISTDAILKLRCGDPRRLIFAVSQHFMNTTSLLGGRARLHTLSMDEIESLAVGAWVLGAGGGGNPYHGLLIMRELYRGGAQVSLQDPLSLDDDSMIAVVSSMGAPLAGEERLPDAELAARPVRMLEQFLGRKFTGVMSLEIGGANAIQPLLVAATLGLPVVDADSMGRAFPEAQMTSFAIGDLTCFPFCLADVRDNVVVISRAASWKWMERLGRRVVTEVGSIAATCKAPRSGAEVKRWAILHTTTQAIGLGQTIRHARRAHQDPVAAAVEAGDGKLIFRGKVVDVDRRATEGFLRGSATLTGFDQFVGTQLRLEFQNEFAVGFVDDQPVLSVPDLICVLDSVSGEAVGTETLRYGQRVSVVAFAAPAILRTSKGLSHVGPEAFGYEFGFKTAFPKVAPSQ